MSRAPPTILRATRYGWSPLPAVAGRERGYRIALRPAARAGGSGPRPGKSGKAGSVSGGVDAEALGGASGGGGGGGSLDGATALESG